MAEENGTRFSSIDILKGIAIIGIVLVHVVIRRSEGGGETPLFMQTLYLILMSFFLISGYFYRPGQGFKQSMKKRVLQLGVAITICSIVLPAIMMIWLFIVGQAPADPLNDYVEAVLRAMNITNLFEPVDTACICPLSGASIGYYYIWVMLGAFIIFYAFADLVMDRWGNICAMIIALLIITYLMVQYMGVRLPFFFHLAPIAAAFMFMGAALAKVDIVGKIESFELGNVKYWLPLIVSAVILVPFVILFHPGTGFDQFVFGNNGAPSVYSYFVQASAMFVICIYITAFMSKIPGFTAFFTMFGKHSLGILLLHGFFIKLFMAPFFELNEEMWFPGGLSMMQKVILSVAVFTACIIICEFGPRIVRKLMGKDPVPE